MVKKNLKSPLTSVIIIFVRIFIPCADILVRKGMFIVYESKQQN